MLWRGSMEPWAGKALWRKEWQVYWLFGGSLKEVSLKLAHRKGGRSSGLGGWPHCLPAWSGEGRREHEGRAFMTSRGKEIIQMEMDRRQSRNLVFSLSGGLILLGKKMVRKIRLITLSWRHQLHPFSHGAAFTPVLAMAEMDWDHLLLFPSLWDPRHPEGPRWVVVRKLWESDFY